MTFLLDLKQELASGTGKDIGSRLCHPDCPTDQLITCSTLPFNRPRKTDPFITPKFIKVDYSRSLGH